jgi:hypothetical protein
LDFLFTWRVLLPNWSLGRALFSFLFTYISIFTDYICKDRGSSLLLFALLLVHLFILFSIIHLFTCTYIVWVISPPCSSPLPQFQAGPVLPLLLILLKKRHKPKKEDKAFLLVELRIAIQKYVCLCNVWQNWQTHTI